MTNDELVQWAKSAGFAIDNHERMEIIEIGIDWVMHILELGVMTQHRAARHELTFDNAPWNAIGLALDWKLPTHVKYSLDGQQMVISFYAL